MFTRQDLARLEQALGGMKVLSVYVDGSAADPALREARSRALLRLVAHERDARRGASREELEAFDACVRRLQASLASPAEAPSAPGWVGFFPARGDAHVEALPVRPPTMVAWDDGPRIAPYVRALKQHRPAIVVVVGAQAASIQVYVRGTLSVVEKLHVEPTHVAGTHTGRPPRMGFHPGAHGSTGADEHDRERHAAFERMRRQLVSQVEVLAGERAWILVGGSGPVPSTVIEALPARMRARARRIAGVDARTSQARLRAAVERAVSAATQEHDDARVLELLDARDAGGRGIAGAPDALGALRLHAVDCLLFTGAFLEREPARAESLVRLALAQGAEVEHVSGAAAERLDAAGGVAARLRFTPAPAETALAMANG